MANQSNCEVKVQSRDGGSLRTRWTDLDEVAGWGPEDLSADTSLTARTPAGEVTYTAPEPPVARRAIYLPDGSWIEAEGIGDFVRVVRDLLAGRSAAEVYAAW